MKFQEYLQQGYVCFISGKYLNGNAAKVADEEQEQVLTALLAHHNNLPDTLVCEGLQPLCGSQGVEIHNRRSGGRVA